MRLWTIGKDVTCYLTSRMLHMSGRTGTLQARIMYQASANSQATNIPQGHRHMYSATVQALIRWELTICVLPTVRLHSRDFVSDTSHENCSRQVHRCPGCSRRVQLKCSWLTMDRSPGPVCFPMKFSSANLEP